MPVEAAAAAGWTPTEKPSGRGFVAEKRAASGRLELAVVQFRDALLLPAGVKPPALQISLRHSVTPDRAAVRSGAAHDAK